MQNKLVDLNNHLFADILNRDKALKSGEWIYCAYISIRNEKAYIQKLLWELVDETFPPPVEIDPHTAGRYTQGNDMNGNEIFEDDLITGASGQVMCIRYGEYQAYCPADEAFMRAWGSMRKPPAIRTCQSAAQTSMQRRLAT